METATAITLCMIVKNEESTLAACLNSIAAYMDEIIIVDTGSADQTREIALQYTDKVFDFQWVNDFAAARNFSISKAGNDFILVLDSDEIVESINIYEIKKLAESSPAKIGRLLRINEYTRGGNPYKYKERVNRLFSKKYYRYEGIIHEQVVPIINVRNEEDILPADTYPDEADNTYLLPLTIRHSGYEGELENRKKKTDRNISLLKKALEKTPEDPYLYYQLGKSFYMEEDYQNACSYLGQALYYDLDTRLEYVQDLVESYGYSLINSGQYETALQLLGVYEDFAHSADFLFLVALILMNNGRFQEAVDEFLKAVEKRECKMEGVNSYLSFYNIGVIYECLGKIAEARSFYKKCGDYGPASLRLRE